MRYTIQHYSQFGHANQVTLDAKDRPAALDAAFDYFQDREDGPSACYGDMFRVSFVNHANKRVLPRLYGINRKSFMNLPMSVLEEYIACSSPRETLVMKAMCEARLNEIDKEVQVLTARLNVLESA